MEPFRVHTDNMFCTARTMVRTFPLRTTTSAEKASSFVSHRFLTYGLPVFLLSDNVNQVYLTVLPTCISWKIERVFSFLAT